MRKINVKPVKRYILNWHFIEITFRSAEDLLGFKIHIKCGLLYCGAILQILIFSNVAFLRENKLTQGQSILHFLSSPFSLIKIYHLQLWLLM